MLWRGRKQPPEMPPVSNRINNLAIYVVARAPIPPYLRTHWGICAQLARAKKENPGDAGVFSLVGLVRVSDRSPAPGAVHRHRHSPAHSRGRGHAHGRGPGTGRTPAARTA